MNYRQFVKENFHKLGDMPAKDKMKKLGEMWRKSGHSKKPTGGSVVGGKAKRMPKKRGGAVAGGGVISGLLDSIGLGVPEKPKGGAVASEGASGGGILSGLLGSIGLGMPEKVLHKHFNKMTKLENKLHTTGKLTPGEHHKLKVYHHLHGAGFFDKIFSGIKKGVSAVVDNMDTIKKIVPEVIKHAPTAINLAKKVMGKGVAGGKMKAKPAKRGKGGGLASSLLEMII